MPCPDSSLCRGPLLAGKEPPMIDPDKTVRGRRLDTMTVPELTELREWVMSNGAAYGSRQNHMMELAIIDEHISAAKRRTA